jgi:hypothetical protein
VVVTSQAFDQNAQCSVWSLAQPASGVFAGIIDRVLEPSALVDTGIQEARRLAALPAFGRVKQQLRAVTVERLAQIVERDDELC